MIGDNIIRGNRLSEVFVASFYCVVGVLIGLIILGIALTTAAYTNIEFPTTNDGMYGFLMTSVQSRVPLALIGGSTVTAPEYNSNYSEYGVSPGAPIDPTYYYKSSTPFSTCAWWSRLVCQKAPTAYTPAMPFIYSGAFNLYRSKAVPSFAITIARPYSLGSSNIAATKVCGQETTGIIPVTRSLNISDPYPTCFSAPILWNVSHSRPYYIGTEMNYKAQEAGNMTAEMSYNAPVTGDSMRITLSQLVPYVMYSLSPGATMSLNSFYRDGDPSGAYSTIKLVNAMPSPPPPFTIPNTSQMVFKSFASTFSGNSPPLGLSQTSVVQFQITFSPPATVSQLADDTVLITADNASVTPTRMVLLPSTYRVSNPRSGVDPQYWVNIDSVVSAVILGSIPINKFKSYVSSTSRNGQATVTYYSDVPGQPLFFVPSLTMLKVGTLSGAIPIPSAAPPVGSNYWLTPQGISSIYVASNGRFDVTYPIIEPPRFGLFDIYAAFDANSLSRMSKIYARDLEALYSIDIPNDSLYTSIRKIFTFAQYTYAVAIFPATTMVQILLPPLRNHLMTVIDELIQTNIQEIQLGYNPTLFTVATGNSQYGASQNQVFGDNHIGQYGMLLYSFYILVAIQYDNTAKRAARDRFSTVMVDLMRDIAQPYTTDQYIPSMRHFDFSSGISWQTSSIIEASSLQVSEITNGYYACWLVASLFSDTKLRDFYRAILSIELATHQEYRLAPLSTEDGSASPIVQMITAANALYENCNDQEFRTASPAFYTRYGTTAYLIQCGEIVLHGVRNEHPDYTYLVENVHPNTVADFSVISFYRPMTPLTIGVVPLTLGINLNTFQTTVFTANSQFVGLGALGPVVQHDFDKLHILTYDLNSGLPAQILSQEANPSAFMTVQGAYSLSSYATHYITNYTWAGANLPSDTCAIIPSTELPDYLAPVIQYNKLSVSDSNTIFWIQFVNTAYGNRK